MEEEDCSKTYSPTVSEFGLKALLQFCTDFDLDLNAFDVNAAYLLGQGKDKIYMRFPFPFGKLGMLLLLTGNLYGLRRAGKIFYEKFTYVGKDEATQTAKYNRGHHKIPQHVE